MRGSLRDTLERVLEALAKCRNTDSFALVILQDSARFSKKESIYAKEAAKCGGQFISLWMVIADDQGRYTAYGKDRDGTTKRLRADDGIHFTAAGYELIAERIVGLMSAAAANAPASGARSAAVGPGGALDRRWPSAW